MIGTNPPHKKWDGIPYAERVDENRLRTIERGKQRRADKLADDLAWRKESMSYGKMSPEQREDYNRRAKRRAHWNNMKYFWNQPRPTRARPTGFRPERRDRET